MEHNNFPQDAASSAQLPQVSAATYGKMPHDAATTSVPGHADAARTSEHVLTVRDVVRMFELEDIHVAERTIVNWCNRNKSGLVRLDAFYDEGERRYFITPSSVELVLQEEKAKLRKGISDLAALGGEVAAPFRTLPQDTDVDAATFRKMPHDAATAVPNSTKTENAEEIKTPHASSTQETTEKDRRIKELEQENLDLKITNRGKDYFIEALNSDKVRLIDIIQDRNHQVGTLEERVRRLQIGARGETRIHEVNDANPRPERSRGEEVI
jgi:hypothetical protein